MRVVLSRSRFWNLDMGDSITLRCVWYTPIVTRPFSVYYRDDREVLTLRYFVTAIKENRLCY